MTDAPIPTDAERRLLGAEPRTAPVPGTVVALDDPTRARRLLGAIGAVVAIVGGVTWLIAGGLTLGVVSRAASFALPDDAATLANAGFVQTLGGAGFLVGVLFLGLWLHARAVRPAD